MGPLFLQVLSLLNWREEFLGSTMVGLCVVLRSVCDGWQPVLTGAVFNLINGDKHEVEQESKFLHFLCSWSFGCEGRLPLAKSVIMGLMLASCVQGVANATSHGIKDAMRNRQSAKLRIAMFEHLLAQDIALYDTRRKRDLANKAELKVMDQITEWLWSLISDLIKLGTQLVFLFCISPLMTLVYVVLLPVVERIRRRATTWSRASGRSTGRRWAWTACAPTSCTSPSP
ncbi:unnamed protein product [Prorocentrum cordatum]|uniref:ABC transmembrane type-1 domain-containing protein n=1 Tax=Prorocentrum cordatum TaxID=2364126 RepID=A0ABN9U826_9DINO|nr:unnamed protein product [Polarella glacialis]